MGLIKCVHRGNFLTVCEVSFISVMAWAAFFIGRDKVRVDFKNV